MRDPRQELVRIDVRGEAHAIGVVASQQLRARAGTFRLLPSPRHLVVMRFTGEDGQRGPEDGRLVRLCGEIDSGGVVCDVLALVAQAGYRGELVVLDLDTVRSIYFDSGNVVGAQTNLVEERLGEVSYRYGVLSREQLERIASHKQEKPARFGETAVELGLLSREQLYSLVNRQVETIVFSAMTVTEGMFFFLDGFGDSRPASNHAVSANALLMDGVTRLDELRYFRQKIPSHEYVPVRVEGRGAPSEEFSAVFAAVDGKSSVEDVGRTTGLGEFEATKQLYALVQSHHVSIHPPRPSGGPAALVEAANSALREIASTVETHGTAAEHRESLASFAVGAGVYELLFRGAGPDNTGALDAEQVVQNALIMTAGADSESLIKQMLHEYVSFALFSAGALLGSERETELVRKLRPQVASLMPHG